MVFCVFKHFTSFPFFARACRLLTLLTFVSSSSESLESMSFLLGCEILRGPEVVVVGVARIGLDWKRNILTVLDIASSKLMNWLKRASTFVYMIIWKWLIWRWLVLLDKTNKNNVCISTLRRFHVWHKTTIGHCYVNQGQIFSNTVANFVQICNAPLCPFTLAIWSV